MHELVSIHYYCCQRDKFSQMVSQFSQAASLTKFVFMRIFLHDHGDLSCFNGLCGFSEDGYAIFKHSFGFVDLWCCSFKFTNFFYPLSISVPSSYCSILNY